MRRPDWRQPRADLCHEVAAAVKVRADEALSFDRAPRRRRWIDLIRLARRNAANSGGGCDQPRERLPIAVDAQVTCFPASTICSSGSSSTRLLWRPISSATGSGDTAAPVARSWRTRSARCGRSLFARCVDAGASSCRRSVDPSADPQAGPGIPRRDGSARTPATSQSAGTATVPRPSSSATRS